MGHHHWIRELHPCKGRFTKSLRRSKGEPPVKKPSQRHCSETHQPRAMIFLRFSIASPSSHASSDNSPQDRRMSRRRGDSTITLAMMMWTSETSLRIPRLALALAECPSLKPTYILPSFTLAMRHTMAHKVRLR
eukprot:Blabericola_migrator_1__6084@NODE_3070_length_2064_cov_16_553831_g1918_i0_p1_GENE_NODE_3070_length_2064_cov_16_553831_g1918_i0NODE_3070_length_2064_cov_16_553831_g1918_i0_p1_ORF_typecomplete_len134_score6_31_NODE_3070_length_2064_cov_16_553831_g1918_i049450